MGPAANYFDNGIYTALIVNVKQSIYLSCATGVFCLTTALERYHLHLIFSIISFEFNLLNVFKATYLSDTDLLSLSINN
jgi:hypothetical protein